MTDTKVYNPKDYEVGTIVETSFTRGTDDAPKQYVVEGLKRDSKGSDTFLVQMYEVRRYDDQGLPVCCDTLEEFNPYWINKTVKQGTGGVRWAMDYSNPHLYPAGTVVRARNLPGSYADEQLRNKLYTVKGLVCNGVGSYCIITTEPNPCETIGGNKSFNLSWVSQIVKRGDGKVVWLNSRQTTPPDPWVKQAYFFVPKIKTIHVVYDLEDAVMQSLWFKDLTDVHIDMGRLKAQLMEQSWVRRFEYRQAGGVFIVNKKRLKRWLTQNLNRFKLKKALAIAQYEQFMQESYRDSDYDWGDHGE